MEATCRICGTQTEIPDYRAKHSDFSCRPCWSALQRERRANGQWKKPVRTDALREYEARQAKKRIQNPVDRPKVLARKRVQKQWRLGKLVKQPCEICGETKVEAHHDDYSQPLAVRWLCRPHHREHHNKETVT